MNAEAERLGGIPRHVFISYSRKDAGPVARLVSDLRAAGIPMWMDKDLTPDTPSWNTAIRQAISDAYVVVYVASPDAATSDAVFGELTIAKSADRKIIAAWVTGDDWSACAPISLIGAQFTDLRPASYQSTIPDLIARLQAIMNAYPAIIPLDSVDQLLPGHFLIDLNGVDFANPHLAIPGKTLPHALAVRPSGFESFDGLTSHLYLDYLQGAVPAYTYGQEWILTSAYYADIRVIMAPLDWLQYRFDSEWIPVSVRSHAWSANSLETLGLLPETRWTITRDCRQEALGVVTNIPDISKLVAQLCLNDRYRSGRAHKAIGSLLWEDRTPRKTLGRFLWDALSARTGQHEPVLDPAEQYRYQFIFATSFHLGVERPIIIDTLPEWYRGLFPDQR